jgi:prevent-host-death family protein
METIGAQEAKTHLSQLLKRVAGGEQITITESGVPVAVLVPPEMSPKMTVQEIFAEIDKIAERNRLDGLSIREMIEEGRD